MGALSGLSVLPWSSPSGCRGVRVQPQVLHPVHNSPGQVRARQARSWPIAGPATQRPSDSLILPAHQRHFRLLVTSFSPLFPSPTCASPLLTGKSNHCKRPSRQPLHYYQQTTLSHTLCSKVATTSNCCDITLKCADHCPDQGSRLHPRAARHSRLASDTQHTPQNGRRRRRVPRPRWWRRV